VTAGEIARYFTLTEGGRAALDPGASPEQFAQALAQAGQYPDAVQVLAHYLPKRQAVFWAMTCVRAAVPPAPQSEPEAALRAAERWIADPTEEHRAAALKAADAADAGTPAGCTALAAYYSEGLPRVEDARTNARAWFLTAKLVSSAVMLAATAEPDKMAARFREFVEKGLEIVRKSRR
jgi:TPR repeat protein